MAKKIIKAQMKQRIDTKANWASNNPVLLLGELGMVSDDPNLYKVGDGTTAWNALPFRGFDGTITQETGSSENTVMSQKAVTEALAELRETTDIFIEDLQNTKIDKESDDYYPSMSVGVADHLAGHDEPTPSEFTFRKSGGGAILSGNARVQSVKGNSVVWNQHLSIKTKLTYTNAAGSSYYGLLGLLPYYNTAINGRRIFAIAKDSKNQLKSIYFNDNLQRDLRGGCIFTANTTVSDRTSVFAEIEAGISVNTDVEVFFYDLTQMFGAGNEPQTIDDFYSRIPQGIDIDAYNEGEVIHMNVDAVKSVGFNQWNEEWEKGAFDVDTGANYDSSQIRSKNLIPVVSGASYKITTPQTTGIWIMFLNSEEDIVAPDNTSFQQAGKCINIKGSDPRSITIPLDAVYMRFYAESSYGSTYNNDICINLSDTSINGKYFPYVSRKQSLAILSKYFPQGMKSAGAAHDEVRFNKTTQKWEAVKRIGEVDLGELNYDKSGVAANAFYTTDLQLIVRKESKNILSAKFVSGNDAANNGVMSNDINGTMYFNLAPYTDAASFKAAMQGVILYYELANPIVTEIEEAFNLDYEVWNGGTEQAIADTPTSAFKADIIYGFNAYGVIKELREQLATLQAAIAKMNA